MILCKKNDKIFIFTVHWRIIYVVSENRNIGSVGGGGSFGKPAPGHYKSDTVQKLNYVFFHFILKKIVELESNPDSTGPGQCSTILWYLGGELDRYRDDIWELPRDCDQPDKSWGWHCRQSCGTRWGWGRGCLTVQEYLPDLDVSDMPYTPTTSAEPLQIKAKDLPSTELEVCLKFAFFISQEVIFSVM